MGYVSPRMGSHYNDSMSTKQKFLIGGGILIVIAILAKVILYFSTGWTYEETPNFEVRRVSTSCWIANYSETTYNVMDNSWDSEDWSEPASSVAQMTKVNGNKTGDMRTIQHKGDEYPSFPSQWTKIDRSNLDSITKSVEEFFEVNGDYGVDESVSRSEYYKFLELKLGNKCCYVVFHHGKYWGYSTTK
jgi:hypothetical protein